MDKKYKNIACNFWNNAYMDNIIDSKYCQDCRNYILSELKEHMSYPVPLPYIGEKFFDKNSRRILFVGIESYAGKELKLGGTPKYDTFDDNWVAELYFTCDHGRSPFWRWVKNIAESIIQKEEDSFRYIAWSNLLKCQARKINIDDSDFEPNEFLCRNCIQNARWIFKEIRELQPYNVIIFSGRKDGCFLSKIFLNDDRGILIKKFDYSGYDLPSRTLKIRKNRDLFTHLKIGEQRIILTNHPRGTPLEIRDEIIRIISDNDWSGAIDWQLPK